MTGTTAVVTRLRSIAGPRDETGRYWQRRPSSRDAFLTTTLAVLAITLLRNTYIFTTHVYEDGDFALNSILVNHTHSSVQLVGNYSRVGFDHPGPAYIYVLSAGQTLFYDWLHIVPSQYGGQIIGVAIFQSIMVGLVVMSIYRITRSLVALLVAASIIFAFAARHDMLGYIWMPYLYMPAFALLIAGGTAVASGYTRDAPLLVLAGCFLVHGHVAFIAFVALSVLFVVGGWLVHHHSRWREEIAANRRSLLWSAVTIAIFLVPMVVEVIRHYPGPWKDYYHYSTSHATKPHSASASVSYLGHFWSSSLPIWVTVVAAAAGLVSLVLDHDRRRRSYVLCGYGLLAVETVMCFFYISRGVDQLTSLNYYTGYFYQTVPLFLVVFAAAHTGMLVHERLTAGGVAWGPVVLPILSTAVAVALVVAGAGAANLNDPYRGSDIYPKIVTALANDPDRDGRPIILDITQDTWPAAAGTVIQADRAGLSLCLQDPYWTLLFTAASMCPNATGRWPVALVTRATWNHQGQVIWSDADTVVYEGTTTSIPGTP
jgi:hypothetical protein